MDFPYSNQDCHSQVVVFVHYMLIPKYYIFVIKSFLKFPLQNCLQRQGHIPMWTELHPSAAKPEAIREEFFLPQKATFVSPILQPLIIISVTQSRGEPYYMGKGKGPCSRGLKKSHKGLGKPPMPLFESSPNVRKFSYQTKTYFTI